MLRPVTSQDIDASGSHGASKFHVVGMIADGERTRQVDVVFLLCKPEKKWLWLNALTAVRTGVRTHEDLFDSDTSLAQDLDNVPVDSIHLSHRQSARGHGRLIRDDEEHELPLKLE